MSDKTSQTLRSFYQALFLLTGLSVLISKAVFNLSFYAILVGSWFYLIRSPRDKIYRFYKSNSWIITISTAYGMLAVLSYFWSEDLAQYKDHALLFSLWIFIWPVGFLVEELDLKAWVRKAFLTGVALAGLMGILFFFGIDFGSNHEQMISRFSPSSVGVILYGCISLCWFFPCVSLYLRKPRLWKLLFTAFILAGIVASGTKTAWLALFLLSPAIFFFQYPLRRKIPIFFLLAITILTILLLRFDKIAYALSVKAHSSTTQAADSSTDLKGDSPKENNSSREQATVSGSNSQNMAGNNKIAIPGDSKSDSSEDELTLTNISSLRYRLESWKVALEIFKYSPLLGTGVGDFKHDKDIAIDKGEMSPIFKHSRDAHSEYFECLASLGAVGLTLLMTILSTLFFKNKCVEFRMILLSFLVLGVTVPLLKTKTGIVCFFFLIFTASDSVRRKYEEV